jgi:thiol-disulfide isomerase/thioredoxin
LICTVALAADPSTSKRLEEYKGKIIVLNFWAAWCKPCKKELPLLAELQREFGVQGVQFIGANTDDVKDREKAQEFLSKMGEAYPVWFGFSEEDMKLLGLGTIIPATAIFDREGKRAFRLIGEIKRKDLLERLQWLLESSQGKPPKELLLPFGISSAEYNQDR